MTEQRTTYDAGQPTDRLAEIKKAHYHSASDVYWLITEVERLRKQVDQLAKALSVAVGIEEGER